MTNRALSSLELTVCALQGSFRLQFDAATGKVQYPPREVAAGSLSTDLEWRDADPRGVVLAATVLHASGSPYTREHLPWPVVLVETSDGAVIVAHAFDPLAAGDTVSLSLRLDRAGRGVFCASADGDSGAEHGIDYGAVRGEFLHGAAGAVLRLVGDDTRGVRGRLLEAAIEGDAERVVLGSECYAGLAPELRSLPGVEMNDTDEPWPLRVDFT